MPDKSVAQKLLMKEGYRVLLVDPPEDYKSMLGELPPEINLLTGPSEPVDMIQLFVTSRKELEKNLTGLKNILKSKGLLWVTYPKGTSGVKADINRDSIREYAQSLGMEGVAMISIDETWSALRLKIL